MLHNHVVAVCCEPIETFIITMRFMENEMNTIVPLRYDKLHLRNAIS